MPKSEPSNRAAAKVDLTFSIPIPGTDVEVAQSIPITLYAGTVSDHGIKRSRYVSTEAGDHEVGMKNYDKETGEDVAYSEIVMKVHTEYGPVYVEDHEIEELFEITPDSVVVKQYLPLHLFHQGHYLPKGRQDIQPRVEGSGKKKGPNKNSVKMLNTLLKAMREKGACALVDVTTRGIPKPAIITPDGFLWLIHHTEEVRSQHDRPDYEPTEGELMVFAAAIDKRWTTEPVEVTDERSALIQDFADQKAAAGEFDRPEEVVVERKAPEPEQDMMALLMASVEAAQANTKAAG